MVCVHRSVHVHEPVASLIQVAALKVLVRDLRPRCVLSLEVAVVRFLNLVLHVDDVLDVQ